MFLNCYAFSYVFVVVVGCGGGDRDSDGVCVCVCPSFITGRYDGIISVPVSTNLFASDLLLIGY